MHVNVGEYLRSRRLWPMERSADGYLSDMHATLDAMFTNALTAPGSLFNSHMIDYCNV